jgi:hypothetical protein
LKGLYGIQSIFEDMLNYDSCDFISARGYFFDKRPKYIREWSKRAAKQGFTMRNIVDKDVKGHKITELPYAETRYSLPAEYANLSVFWIYGNKVVISNWAEEEPTAIIMNNKHMYDMYKRQFEILWDK